MDNQLDVLISNADLVKPIIVQILFYENINMASNWVSGGTGFFVTTGQNTFLVTACHVIDERGDAITYIGGNGHNIIDISNWPVLDRNKDVDICTLQIPDCFKPSEIGKEFWGDKEWPAERAGQGENVLILGFPSKYRSATVDEVIAGISIIDGIITNISEFKLTIADEDNSRKGVPLDEGLPVINHFGGMSGSPIFAYRPEDTLELVGIFIESVGQSFLGLEGLKVPFCGAHLDFIDPMGMIKLEMIPPRFVDYDPEIQEALKRSFSPED